MKNFFILPLLLFCYAISFGQQAKQLIFREETYDFGRVIEQNGPVTHEFLFTNSSNRPVKIIDVQASCGCTTPGWSKEIIQPGKTGFIQASFDPRGRPGFFSKSLTVVTDLDPNPVMLQIKGQVSSDTDQKVDDTGFTHAHGSLKFKSSSFNMGKVFMVDEFVTKEFRFVNGSEKPITFQEKIVGPSHIKIQVVPIKVAAGAKGTIKVQYNGKMKNNYGFQSDNIEITTDDVDHPVKSISVLATIEDYFPQLSAEELNKAPQLQLSQTSLDVGRVNVKTTLEREVSFTNTGKKDLVVKAVQGNCTCVKPSISKTTIKPGEMGKIKVEFTPQDRTGTQNKAITIYSNDPRNPVQRFTLTAYVD